MADIENTDLETVREVEKALESRWARQFAVGDDGAVSKAGGADVVAKILAACDPRRQGRILANLAAQDRPLAERFGHRTIAFDDLEQCDPATIQAVVGAADPEVLQVALFGAMPAIVERFLHGLSKDEANRLRWKLDHPEPIRLSDVEEAQRQIAALAQQLLTRVSSDGSDRTSFAA